VITSDFTVGDIACEAIRPEYAHNPGYAILHVHGGGYVSGGLSYAGVLASKLAIATGFTTYTFEYRLAQEHPYPAALNDAMAVWNYLMAGRYLPERILVTGESAGGNLALCMTQKLLEDSRQLPCQLLLFSPWTDMTQTAGSYDTNEEYDPILTRQYVNDAAKVYIDGTGDAADKRFSPLFGELGGLPPVYIMAGRNEILLDDSVRLFDGITKLGGKAQLDIEENGWHVYQQMPVPIATRAMKRLAAYVSDQIYGENIWEVTTGIK
jgi:acetyl esterase/lipase